jgi:hypothetical protein
MMIGDDHLYLEAAYTNLKNAIKRVLEDLTAVNELTNTPTLDELRDTDAAIDKAIHDLEVALEWRKA